MLALTEQIASRATYNFPTHMASYLAVHAPPAVPGIARPDFMTHELFNFGVAGRRDFAGRDQLQPNAAGTAWGKKRPYVEE